MRYIVFDLETTGLDLKKDRITELGFALYEKGNPAPLFMKSDFIKQDAPLNPEIVALTGITDELLTEFGRDSYVVFEEFLDFAHKTRVQFFAGHNAIGFDIPLLRNELGRFNLNLPELPVLDTKFDLPLDYKPKSTSLSYMAADHGFLNPFAHRALFDSLTCGVLISKYPLDLLVRVINSPLVTIRAAVSYDNRSQASSRGYYWDAKNKFWLKKVRACNLHKEEQNDFQVIKVNEEDLVV